MDLTDEKLRRVAFHEAGHAWMMVKEGLGVDRLSMQPSCAIEGDNRGETLPGTSLVAGNRGLSERFARAALAGIAAEHFLSGSWDDESLHAKAYDSGRAKSYLSMSGEDWSQEGLQHYVLALGNAVMDEISRPRAWHAITVLACELLASGQLSGQQVLETLAGTG